MFATGWRLAFARWDSYPLGPCKEFLSPFSFDYILVLTFWVFLTRQKSCLQIVVPGQFYGIRISDLAALSSGRPEVRGGKLDKPAWNARNIVTPHSSS
jgi:hypothetical protein